MATPVEIVRPYFTAAAGSIAGYPADSVAALSAYGTSHPGGSLELLSALRIGAFSTDCGLATPSTREAAQTYLLGLTLRGLIP